ncbi:uncharacterized protein LOC143034965 [Oratosquilla oratoria]|uniref:uncharacterized protein LOC143034965 n=1 Tax=Oratosquilla oratoria TaxID=337810 RepID=UPI003F775C90
MQIVYKGYLFSQTREYRETRYFGCVKRKRKECFCRVHVVGHRVVKEIGEHSHPPLYKNLRLKGVIHVGDDGVVEVPEGQESPFSQGKEPKKPEISSVKTVSASSSPCPSVSSVHEDISGYWYDPAALNYQCLDIQVKQVELEDEDPPFIGPYLSSTEAAAKGSNRRGNSARQSGNSIRGRTSFAPIASPEPSTLGTFEL